MKFWDEQGILDAQKAPEMVSPKMTGVLCVYSALFMRFSLAIAPRNVLLFACHAANEVVQLNQLRRWYQSRSLSVTEKVFTDSNVARVSVSLSWTELLSQT